LYLEINDLARYDGTYVKNDSSQELGIESEVSKWKKINHQVRLQMEVTVKNG
jgi:hypothetical protein